jgi:hypothetical protein
MKERVEEWGRGMTKGWNFLIPSTCQSKTYMNCVGF